MHIFLPKYKKLFLSIVLILTISSLGIFIFGAQQAQAEGWTSNAFVNAILTAIGYLLLGILWLCGQIMNVAQNLVSLLLLHNEFTKADIVKIGWGIVRDLTNMFFILVLLIIAFASILRIEQYGVKQILWKLVVAALLINFSLVLAGPIIDFSQVLTMFFLEQSGGEDFTERIAIALTLSKFIPTEMKNCAQWSDCSILNPPCKLLCIRDHPLNSNRRNICNEQCNTVHCKTCDSWEAITSIEEYKWTDPEADKSNMIMGLLMAIVFSMVAIFCFFAFAFFLIIRILYLWFLLILAPIVWLAWVLPATKKYFTDWWNMLFKWSFFAPIYMFFVYLALRSYKTLLSVEMIDQAMGQNNTATILPTLLQPQNFLQFILVLGILVGGLIVAQKMSVYGAKGAVEMGKKPGQWASGWSKKKATGAGNWGATQTARALQSGLTKGRGIPIIRRAAAPFRARVAKERAEKAKKIEGKFSGWTAHDRQNYFKVASPQEKAAIAQGLAKDGELKENKKTGFTEKDIQTAVKLAQKYNRQKEVLMARPDLAYIPKNESEEEQDKARVAIKKAIPFKDITKMQTEAVKNSLVIEVLYKEVTEKDGRLKGANLAKLAEFNPDISAIIQKEIIPKIKENWKEVEKIRPDITNYLKGALGKTIFGDVTPPKEEEPKIIIPSKYESVSKYGPVE
ncbi:MAG: hypothetical protein V1829_01175 [bacterium]